MIYVNGLDAFASEDWRMYMARVAQFAERFVFVQNDYALRPPIAFRDAYKKDNRPWKPIYWSTIPNKILQFDQGSYVNWNMIGYRYSVDKSFTKFPGLFYYGDLRQRRSQSLLDYFGDQVPYTTTISAPEVSHDDFRRLLGNKVSLIPPLNSLYRELSQWTTTIYIEDEYSHGRDTSPATRFYECLSVGVAQLVDINAAGTLLRHFNVTPYIVSDMGQVKNRLKDWLDIAVAQQAEFVPLPSHFHTQLQNQVLRAYAALENPTIATLNTPSEGLEGP
jgi:hypothetical protein